MQGDKSIHFTYIQSLQNLSLKQLPAVGRLDESISMLLKFGVLSEEQLCDIYLICAYFAYLKKQNFQEPVNGWLAKINIPEQIIALNSLFNDDKKFKSDCDVNLQAVDLNIKKYKSEIVEQASKIMHTQKIQPYLVDRQVHYFNDEDCLLLRPGFNTVMRGQIIGRSASGFFYVTPHQVSALKEKLSDLINERTHIIWQICKRLSESLYKCTSFLKYIDGQFDRLDHYLARLEFAKAYDLLFIKPNENKRINLVEFCHPSLSKPKPISILIDKQISLITGVNAGGKTILLKSILSAVIMAKYLIPMRTHISSTIGSFAYTFGIINDPQDVKQDISTFAGRIKDISQTLTKRDSIIGIDEIELGTDSDEAATLFSVVLRELIKKGHFVIATTHHKKLAALLAQDENVKLFAALYDESIQKPKYEFLSGTIGKSYAFETALKYGMPHDIINLAKQNYGTDQAKLSELIESSISLQMSLKQELESVTKLKHSLAFKQEQINEQEIRNANDFLKLKSKLESLYTDALKEAKDAAKQSGIEDIHRAMNSANTLVQKARAVVVENKIEPISLAINDCIKWRNRSYIVISVDSKNIVLDDNGKKLKAPKQIVEKEAIKARLQQHKKSAAKIEVSKPNQCSPFLDLHGYYVEEALDIIDQYISDALLAGFAEVHIMHGIGSGRLARAVKEFLKTHQSIKYVLDAPISMGGSGVSIVTL